MASTPPPTFHWQYTELLDDRNFQIRGRTLFYAAVLFSVILLLALLIFYARWLCSSASASASSSGSPTRPHNGLDRAAIDGLPVVILDRASGSTIKHRGEAGEEVECSICLGVLEDGEKVKVLPLCRHCYHSECVDRWLAAQPVCPLCRANLRVEPAVVIQ